MEGRRDDDDVSGAAAAPPQGWYYGRRGGGDGGGGRGSGDDESDGSSGGGVELSLRLRTGSSPSAAPAAAAAEQHEEAAAATRKRSMTIFYDGRVCAVDVTEIQAREIISMANREILAGQRQQQQHREERHVQDRGSASNGGQARPAVGRARQQGLATMVMTTTGQAGLSLKRSLQQFLQKREARRAAAAVAPPYARQAQATRH